MRPGSVKVSLFRREFVIPELADCPLKVRSKLVTMFERNKRPRNRLALVQAGQLFTFLLALVLCIVAKMIMPTDLLWHISIVVLLSVWVLAAGLAGNLATASLRDDFRAFLREHCTGGRPRICLACDYDLRGSPGDRCPECGERVPQWETGESS